MLLGAHVSIAGGIDNAPGRAADWGCEVFQSFSRSPQGGPAPKLTPEIVERFKGEMKDLGLKEHYIHTPYFINFASTNPRIKNGTVGIIRDELERGNILGTKYVMTHLGSAKQVGEEKGIEMVIEGVYNILKDYKGSTELLLEIAAGSGATLGDTFEEMAQIIAGTEKKLHRKNVVNICFDTQHAFASGYDLRAPEAVKKTMKHFDNTIGLERLKLSHCNDSKVDFESHVDRHENIGKGKMGKKSFEAMIASPSFKKVNLILETPHDKVGKAIKKDLAVLKKIRAK